MGKGEKEYEVGYMVCFKLYNSIDVLFIYLGIGKYNHCCVVIVEIIDIMACNQHLNLNIPHNCTSSHRNSCRLHIHTRRKRWDAGFRDFDASFMDTDNQSCCIYFILFFQTPGHSFSTLPILVVSLTILYSL